MAHLWAVIVPAFLFALVADIAVVTYLTATWGSLVGGAWTTFFAVKLAVLPLYGRLRYLLRIRAMQVALRGPDLRTSYHRI